MGIDHFKMRLRELMLEKGLTPRDIESKVGVSYTIIYKYLHKGYHCGLMADTLERLAESLDVSMDDLWRGKDDE